MLPQAIHNAGCMLDQRLRRWSNTQPAFCPEFSGVRFTFTRIILTWSQQTQRVEQNLGLMLGQRRRRWANIKTTLVQRSVPAGIRHNRDRLRSTTTTLIRPSPAYSQHLNLHDYPPIFRMCNSYVHAVFSQIVQHHERKKELSNITSTKGGYVLVVFVCLIVFLFFYLFVCQ